MAGDKEGRERDMRRRDYGRGTRHKIKVEERREGEGEEGGKEDSTCARMRGRISEKRREGGKGNGKHR